MMPARSIRFARLQDLASLLRQAKRQFVFALLWLATASTHALAETFDLPPEGVDVVGKMRVVISKSSDTLLDIARHYDLGYGEITAANPGVDPWLPKAGTYIIVPTQFVLPDAPRRGLVLNIPQMRLFYFVPASATEPAKVITHPIGIGREYWGTPFGTTNIVAKRKDPAWYPPESIRQEHARNGGAPLPAVVPAGPNNPLGQFAMNLGMPGYLIHGTNRPWGIGMRVSHGCIRLYPEDIRTLFDQVPVGTPVAIVNQPYVAGWLGWQLYLQAFTPLSEHEPTTSEQTEMMSVILEKVGEDEAVDWRRASLVAREKYGIAEPVLPGAPDLMDIIFTVIDATEPSQDAAPASTEFETQ